MLVHVGVQLDHVGPVHGGLLDEVLQQQEADTPAASARVVLV